MRQDFLLVYFTRLKMLCGSALILYLSVFAHHVSYAQASSAPANKFARLSSATHGTNVVATSSEVCVIGCEDQFNNKERLTNGSLDGASWDYILGGSAWIEVKDVAATGINEYPEGSYAGFVVDAAAIDIISRVTITTYLGSVEKESKSASDLIAVSGVFSGAARIGFWTSKKTDGGNNNFDRIRITYSALGVAGTRTVYYAEVVRYGAGPSLACNTPTSARLAGGSETGYPVAIVNARTGIDGTCVNCAVTDRTSLIDSDPATSAKLNMTASLNGTASISVATVNQVNPGGTFAGFDISNSNLLGVTAGSGILIETYLAGSPTGESVGNGSLIGVGSSLVTGSVRQVFGFKTTLDFDEVRLSVKQTGVSLGVTEVFGLVLTKFCDETSLACNTLTQVKNPTHPVYVDGGNTGIASAVCAGCSINNADFAVDDNTTNSAEIVLTVSALNEAAASFAVSNALETFGETSFAGFKIETNSLITASVLASAKVELLLNGAVVQPWTGSNVLLGVSSTLLNGPNTQIVGVIANSGITYNGVKITFVQPVNANIGSVKIFGAIFDNLCAGTIACNTLYNLNMPSDPPVSGEPNFPVVIDAQKTGSTGVACVLCSVENAYNVVTANTTDFARLSNIASAGTTSIAVVNPIDTYPAGATAGFFVKKNVLLLDADLLSRVTITTYNNGVQQEQKTDSDLLALSVVLFGSTSDVYKLAFMTTKPFDEIQLSLGSLANVTVKSIDVYGSFIDTRTAAGGSLLCFNTNPDNNVTSKGVSVSGNLSTNDNVATGTTYGTPVADPTQPNPSTDLPVMDGDGMGGYTFITSIPGIYSFNVPVCVPGQPSCFTESLTITVLDKDIITNPPVANDDVAIVKGNETTPVAVIVDVTANDGPGNPGGTLGDPTIPNPPAPGIGTAVVENGKIKFTPATGAYGEVTIVYQVCETPSDPQSCTTAKLVVTVLRPEAPNTLTASDDYASVTMNTTLTVSAAEGVLINDSDPDGNTITAVAQSNVVIANVGTFNLATDGSYTFAPVTGYTGPASLIYQATDGTDTKTATLYILVVEGSVMTNPDNNVTYKNVPVSGDVSSNDGVPADYKYGAAVANGTNPSADLPVVAENGSYTFVTATAGIYSFLIPVCLGDQTSGCATEKLTISVLDPSIATNPPVANDDIITIKGSDGSPAPVLVDVTANDGPGNLGGSLGDPTIAIAPTNGTATIVGGKVQYTPNAGFYGKDIVTYQVCETPTHAAACTTAELVVTVLETGAPNTLSAADDYASATMNITLTVSAADGVLANDYDPDGNTLTVTAQNTTVAGAGNLVLAADGSYTFTPVSGYSGPASFVYTVCDGVSGCKTATLYIMVKKVPDLSPSISFRPATIQGTTEIGAILTVYEFNGLASSGTINVYITKDPTYQLAFNSAATSVKGQTVQNSKWTFDATHPAYYLLTTNDVIGAGQSLAVGLTSTFAPGSTRGRTVISAIIADNAGNEVDNTNNADDDTLDYRP